MIELVRDPRAVVYSHLTRGRQGAFPRLARAAYVGMSWTMHQLASKALLGGRMRLVRVRYEDYVEAPDKVVTHIATRAGLARSQIWTSPHPARSNERSVRLAPGHALGREGSTQDPESLAEITLRSRSGWKRGLSGPERLLATFTTLPLLGGYKYPVRAGRGE